LPLLLLTHVGILVAQRRQSVLLDSLMRGYLAPHLSAVALQTSGCALMLL
jgi:hypothetical protein